MSSLPVQAGIASSSHSPNLPGPLMTNPISVARVYANVNSTEKGPDYWDYDRVTVKWGNQEHYEIISKVGRGKYSEVFLGIDVRTDQKVIIKVLKPVKSKKIKREIKILQNLANGVNIIHLLDIVRDPEVRPPRLLGLVGGVASLPPPRPLFS